MIKDGLLDPELLDEDPDQPMKRKFTDAWKAKQAAQAAGADGDDDGEEYVDSVPLKDVPACVVCLAACV